MPEIENFDNSQSIEIKSDNINNILDIKCENINNQIKIKGQEQCTNVINFESNVEATIGWVQEQDFANNKRVDIIDLKIDNTIEDLSYLDRATKDLERENVNTKKDINTLNSDIDNIESEVEILKDKYDVIENSIESKIEWGKVRGDITNQHDFVTETTGGWIDNTFGKGAYGNGIYVLLGNKNMTYSNDCINWKDTGEISVNGFNSIAYGNGTFVATDFIDAIVYYSKDCKEWHTARFDEYTSANKVVFWNDKFIIGYALGSFIYLYISDDGINWTKNIYDLAEFGIDTESFYFGYMADNLSCGNGYLYLTSRNEVKCIYTKNLDIWEIGNTRTISPDFFVIGKDKIIINSYYTSQTFISTTLEPLEWQIIRQLNRIKSLVYGNGMFICVDYSPEKQGMYKYSYDGINWNNGLIEFDSDLMLVNIEFVNDRFFANINMNSKSCAFYSFDGINWNELEKPVNSPLNNTKVVQHPIGKAVGNINTPVYVDEKGEVQEVNVKTHYLGEIITSGYELKDESLHETDGSLLYNDGKFDSYFDYMLSKKKEVKPTTYYEVADENYSRKFYTKESEITDNTIYYVVDTQTNKMKQETLAGYNKIVYYAFSEIVADETVTAGDDVYLTVDIPVASTNVYNKNFELLGTVTSVDSTNGTFTFNSLTYDYAYNGTKNQFVKDETANLNYSFTGQTIEVLESDLFITEAEWQYNKLNYNHCEKFVVTEQPEESFYQEELFDKGNGNTVSADGYLTSILDSTTVSLNNPLTPQVDGALDLSFRFLTPSSWVASTDLLYSPLGLILRIYNTSGLVYWWASSNGTSWGLRDKISTNITLANNTEYDFRLIHDGTGYVMTFTNVLTGDVQTYTYTSTALIKQISTIYDVGAVAHCGAIIDLNSFECNGKKLYKKTSFTSQENTIRLPLYVSNVCKDLYNGIPQVVEQYKDKYLYSGYKIWSNGWIEQSMKSNAIKIGKNTTVTLYKEMKDKLYHVVAGEFGASGHDDTMTYSIISTTQVRAYMSSSGANDGGSTRSGMFTVTGWAKDKPDLTKIAKDSYRYIVVANGKTDNVVLSNYTKEVERVTNNCIDNVETRTDELLEQIQQKADDTALSEKANVDLSNCTRPYIVEVSDKSLLPSWYRVFSDGWCEQGGMTPFNSGSATVTLLKPYIDTNYTVTTSYSLFTNTSTDTEGSANGVSVSTYTTTSFRVSQVKATNTATQWLAQGYIKLNN